jgi:hypothetical protein
MRHLYGQGIDPDFPYQEGAQVGFLWQNSPKRESG